MKLIDGLSAISNHSCQKNKIPLMKNKRENKFYFDKNSIK